jgi:catechol 2,3-dioxygenase-like lactoylglutathione lyase family enzyme
MFETAVAVAFVNVSDHERGRAFYRNTLGLALEAEDEHGEFYRFGAARLRLTTIPGHQAHEHPIAGWQVPDVVATAAALAERGVAFAIYPGMGQDEQGIWSSPDGRVKVAWFHDPDGNCLSLSQA